MVAVETRVGDDASSSATREAGVAAAGSAAITVCSGLRQQVTRRLPSAPMARRGREVSGASDSAADGTASCPRAARPAAQAAAGARQRCCVAAMAQGQAPAHRDHQVGLEVEQASSALKTAPQRPQRTQPDGSWSCTTRNTVLQECNGWPGSCADHGMPGAPARRAVIRIHPSSRSATSSHTTARRPRSVRRPGARGMPASTRSPPGRTCRHSSGASSLSGLARMLASTRSVCRAPRRAVRTFGHAVGLRWRARHGPPGRCRPHRRACAVQRRRDGEDARAAAVVEDASASPPERGGDPAQAHARS